MRKTILAALILFTVSVNADEVSVPYLFEADKRAVASEVNKNFLVLEEGINANHAVLEVLSSDVNELSGDVNKNKENFSTLVEQVNSQQQGANSQGAQLTTVAQRVQNHAESIIAQSQNIKELGDDLSAQQTEIDTNKLRAESNNAKIDLNRINISEQQTSIAQKQMRIASTCEEGSSIRAINIDGSVICEDDDVGVDSGGDITGVTVGTGLIGGGVSGDVNLVIDTNVIQAKLKNSDCATNEYISSIAADGEATCLPLNSVSEITSNRLDINSEEGGVVSINIAPNSISNSLLTSNSVDGTNIQGNTISSSVHILDEPGISTTINEFVCEHSIYSGCEGRQLSDSGTLIAEVAIYAPAAGVVMVSFSGNYYVEHNEFQSEILDIEISDSPEVKVCTNALTNDPVPRPMTLCNNSYREISIGEEIPARPVKGSLHSQMQFVVPSEGNYMFYVYGRYYSYPITSYSEIREHSFTAMYFPTLY